MKVNRGEIWLVDLNPVIGHEQAGVRPGLIISDDLFNHSPAEIVILLPITSKAKGIPSHIMIEYEFLQYKSYIKTEDIRAVSTQRLKKLLGKVDYDVLETVEEHLKLLLGFKQ